MIGKKHWLYEKENLTLCLKQKPTELMWHYNHHTFQQIQKSLRSALQHFSTKTEAPVLLQLALAPGMQVFTFEWRQSSVSVLYCSKAIISADISQPANSDLSVFIDDNKFIRLMSAYFRFT